MSKTTRAAILGRWPTETCPDCGANTVACLCELLGRRSEKT